ncbi:uncharacterized protein CEXT_462871 [Caerostris extrusa]|uniref:Uncharacterized protein n=1 Tax=Caerostris extrusa TaxID=172846 RepID=A0AAV4MBT0_CAEEX|nr:uncharacterized protein CEXT_462871 [Caerostris extrusa]
MKIIFSDYNNDYLDTDIPEEVVHYDLEERSNTYDLSENIENIKIADNDEIIENTFENNEEDVYSFDNNMSVIDNSEENITNSEVNPSPLCLPLEKIDEDDVISASTTTSSETPDTETVIETLPSNLSPLPNDESNGEESSKPLSFEDKEREYVDEIPVPETSPCISSEPIYSGNVEYTNVFDNVPIQERFAPNTSEMYENNENSSPDDQDDEYCRELDESIDQITSLDVIDEIEQRLMHQLEQQGETFEEMDEGLTAQLEQDINKQWLYFSDEVELLDDLTPRNLEPPREPPPPLPPPELDTSDKKDKILPPPPALEEILKQEREQTQWLEKRLSLAETDISTTSSYMNDSMGMEAQDFTQK